MKNGVILLAVFMATFMTYSVSYAADANNNGIEDGSIDYTDIATNSITGSRLYPGTVSTGYIANGAVTSSKIQDGGVNTADIQAGAVTDQKIASVDAGKVTQDHFFYCGFQSTQCSTGYSQWYVMHWPMSWDFDDCKSWLEGLASIQLPNSHIDSAVYAKLGKENGEIRYLTISSSKLGSFTGYDPSNEKRVVFNVTSTTCQ